MRPVWQRHLGSAFRAARRVLVPAGPSGAAGPSAGLGTVPAGCGGRGQRVRDTGGTGSAREAAADGCAGSPDGVRQPPLPGSEPREGRRVLCRMCGNPLRDRVSRVWGLGPDCRHKLAVRTAPAPPGRPVDQEPLPGL
ncbi:MULTISPECIES: DUF6011 domain-containing protein [Streptomyces]|uniref:DUF6011 domain-containing protein n=1 Tax=Streptomyces TaxID=1883 RepID=UPI0035310E1E